MKTVLAADLFCGAGGTSTGLAQACADQGKRTRLLAINHWRTAIETHAANHPWADHLCESLDNVDPRKLVPGGRLHLMVASPECAHHSLARGGKPCSDQSRATAWHILRWAEALYVEAILIENVREFQNWGPIGADGRPLKSKRGETFRAFVGALQSLGYRVEWRVLNAADYGDATTRKRLFIQARRGNKRISWPEPTHAQDPDSNLFGRRLVWRAAREIIDWTLTGNSIFDRKRPLAPATLGRIAEGLHRFGGKAAKPFLVTLRNHVAPRSTKEPLPAILAQGNHLALCEPFLMSLTHGGRVHSAGKPLPTITAANRGELGLVEPFVLGQQSCAAPRPLSRPLPTIAGAGAISLVEPFLVPYYGTGVPSPVHDPVPTVTSKDRFGLVVPRDWDIRFRMLQPHELAAAMGFPADYRFAGNRGDQVRQIGNAVPVGTAKALCMAVLEAA